VRNGFLLPARVVMAVFRGKLLAAMRQALAREELRLPEGIRPQQLPAFCAKKRGDHRG
jgi:hypothetical protein